MSLKNLSRLFLRQEMPLIDIGAMKIANFFIPVIPPFVFALSAGELFSGGTAKG